MAEHRRDVVVTGLGVVSPIGCGVAAFWRALCERHDAAGPLTLFDTSAYRIDLAQTVAVDRGSGDPAVAFALQAAAEAIAQAGLDGDTQRRCGLAVATTAAGWTHGRRLFEAHLAGADEEFARQLQQPKALFKEAALEALGSRFGLEGPCALLSPACAAASSAIAWAAQRVRAGVADVMLAGATDALTEVVYAGFHAMRLLADDACRPFSAGRRGLVLSEGAAFLVLEEASHARRRGATALARLSGWGLSCDAAGPTTPGAAGILRAMTAAVADAGLSAGDIAQVSAHGTGSVANDAAESEAIAQLLGARLADVPVTAIKGTLGHTEGAAGAFGALAAVLSLQHDTLPPLSGRTARDPLLPPLRLITSGAQGHVGRNVLVNASGFGGANASLLFDKPAPPPYIGAPRTGRAVITGTVALTAREGTLVEPGDASFWPRSSLPLDRISSLVLGGAERLLPRACDGAPDEGAAVVLGAMYGSQARHEAIWRALAINGPRGVNPNDFALSTFNAPGSATASACGLGGTNLVFLGAVSGIASLDGAATEVVTGRAYRVLTGAYEEVTPYFRRVMSGLGEPDIAEAVALLLVEDQAEAQRHGANVMATILGSASRAPSARWPAADDFVATMRDALRRAGLEAFDLAAVMLDPHHNSRDAQLRAVESTFGAGLTLVDISPVYGNCLAASAPLAVHMAIESAGHGCWPDEIVLRGPRTLQAGRPVLINAGGLLAGCASMVVVPHGA